MTKRAPSIYMFEVVGGVITGEKRMPAVLPGHVEVTSELRKEYVESRRDYRRAGGKRKITWDGDKFNVPRLTGKEKANANS